MSIGTPRAYLLCYDIADPRRLGRVHRVAREHGVRIQYSVYLVEANREASERLLRELRRHISENEDDVRLYPLPTDSDPATLGRSSLGQGVELCGAALPKALLTDRRHEGDSE